MSASSERMRCRHTLSPRRHRLRPRLVSARTCEGTTSVVVVDLVTGRSRTILFLEPLSGTIFNLYVGKLSIKNFDWLRVGDRRQLYNNRMDSVSIGVLGGDSYRRNGHDERCRMTVSCEPALGRGAMAACSERKSWGSSVTQACGQYRCTSTARG